MSNFHVVRGVVSIMVDGDAAVGADFLRRPGGSRLGPPPYGSMIQRMGEERHRPFTGTEQCRNRCRAHSEVRARSALAVIGVCGIRRHGRQPRTASASAGGEGARHSLPTRPIAAWQLRAGFSVRSTGSRSRPGTRCRFRGRCAGSGLRSSGGRSCPPSGTTRLSPRAGRTGRSWCHVLG